LPDEFYRQFPNHRLRWQPAEWDKPIVYFYTRQPSLQVSATVRFREGAPVVWWPACASPIDDNRNPARGKARPGAAAVGQTFQTLRWNGWLGYVPPNVHVFEPPSGNNWTRPQSFDFGAATPEWITQARLPDAAPITVSGSKIRRGAPWTTTRPETERFLYYDGMVPAPDYLRCVAVTADTLTVRNTGSFPVPQLFVVDRRAERTAKGPAFACRTEAIPPGAEVAIPLKPLERPADLAASVRQALIDAGMFGPEADSILKIWSKDLLEAEGMTAFFLLPQKEYDAMLPLELTPKPAKPPVRVGIVHHPRFEVGPQLRERVARLLKELDSTEFEVRERAHRDLAAMGPWAVGALREALANKPSLETAKRLEALLQDADASVWLKETTGKAMP
jgi:hypothetical protein